MKNILYEIKNFRRLANLNEDVESPVKVVLIGDGLINYLESNDFIMSLLCTSITIKAPKVRVSKKDRLPRIKVTIYSSF